MIEVIARALSFSIYNLHQTGKGFGTGYDVNIEIDTDMVRIDLMSGPAFENNIIKTLRASIKDRKLNEVISDLEGQIFSLS